jgi:hypothetical protein
MARRRILMAAAILALAGGGPALAQSDIFGPEAFHGLADLRLTASSGERSWLEGGFGKTPESGSGDGGWRAGARLSNAALEWRPRFNFAVSAVVVAEAQPQIEPKFDVTEAFLRFQAPPTTAGRFSARAGLMYPPVSMEHHGVAWTSPDMLSGSAINSWIGEEVKVAGVEATWQRAFGDHQFAATGAVFGWNDTSGTLLSFRGWALGGVKAGLRTEYPLPPLTAFMVPRQGDETYPVLELDRRAGYYGRLEWRPPAPVSFNATFYDNAGDRIAVDDELQWAWETRFLNLGAKWEVDERTEVLAQAMNGETLMGYRYQGAIWVDVGYSAAYVLARRRIGEDTLSARIDAFATRDRTLRDLDDNTERGWAATAAWRHRLTPNADVIMEALHVDSRRPARVLAGEAPDQAQTTLQAALRLHF